MNKQEYIDELIEAGKEWIDDYFYGSFDPDEDFDDIQDDMELVITGNDNGSYYCSSAKAKEAIAEAMWDEEIVDLVRDLGYDGIPTDKGPEGVDVIIRYALLGEVYQELRDYFEDNKPSIESIIDHMAYFINKGDEPSVDTVREWREKLEKIQENM